MSEVRLTVRDAQRAITGKIHAHVALAAVAALSAEPETIEELVTAMGRYYQPLAEGCPLLGFDDADRDDPHDLGLIMLDLPSRICVADVRGRQLERFGRIPFHDGRQRTSFEVPYWIPDGWLVLTRRDGWALTAAQRRAEFADRVRLDPRRIVYGELPRALVELILAEPAETGLSPDAALHAQWLMTARADLGGRTPREVMLERHDEVRTDLSAREWQWEMLDACPPTLPVDSAAFRYGGFGTHELVLHYELVRHLLKALRFRGQAECRTDPEGTIVWLKRQLDEWLVEVTDDYHGLSPRQVIDMERARRPWALSPEQTIVDHDCPICRMMAQDMPGTTFCHLDNAEFEPDFAFSFHVEREAWEQEQREYEEFSRACDRRRAERVDMPPSIWQRSMCNVSMILESPPDQPRRAMLMIGLAGHLGELGIDVRDHRLDRQPLQHALSEFDELRAAMAEDSDWQVGPLIDRCQEALTALSDAPGHEVLREKCRDLREKFDALRQLCLEEHSAG